jgi:hypothetical protein
MPSKSKKQQNLFKAAMGAKKGNTKVKGAAKEIAKKMSKKKIKEFIKKESALTNELNALVESAQPENVFDFAYQHVMSLYLEKLDAVGEEDDDIDNDGDSDSTDEYLKKRREKIGAAISKTKGKEEAEEHMHCKHAEEGCDCDGCEECKANQED